MAEIQLAVTVSFEMYASREMTGVADAPKWAFLLIMGFKM